MAQTAAMMINIFFLILSLWFHPRTSAGFSLKLIHRDSPLSPLYQPNLTDSERFLKNAEISNARASYFQQQIDSYATQDVSIRLPARLADPIFTVEIGIGTPAVKRTLIFDTGSGLTWTQCRPCIKCFKQNEPLFDSKKSRSYKSLGKKHPLAGGFRCTLFGCGYYIGYYSGQFSAGSAAVENFTFQSNQRAPAVVNNLAFGCGTTTTGKFPPEISGILGMDKEPTSFARQLASISKSSFSYCLTAPVSSTKPTSYVRFGDEARIRGMSKNKTPFLNKNMRTATLYALNLIDLSINGRKLGLGNGAFPNGCYVDSGASVGLLNKKAYSAARDVMVNHFAKLANVKRYVDKKLEKKFICYKYQGGFSSFPSMTFHFQGADYYVPPPNLFFFVQGEVFCWAMLESKDTTILGALQQRNVRMVFDLKERALSFGPEECSRDLLLVS